MICSCEDILSNNQHEYEEDSSTMIVLSNQTELVVSNTNGSVVITGVDTTNNLYLLITRKVRSRESVEDAESHISDISVSTDANPNNVLIDVDHPTNNSYEYEIDLTIILPFIFNHNVDLGNGSVMVFSSSKNAAVNLGNGSVSADIALQDTCSVNFQVGNGDIDLSIPVATNAILEAAVGNGNVSSSGLTINDQIISGSELRGTLGNGIGAIVLSVGNGSITLSAR
jgi:hypothetical protein